MCAFAWGGWVDWVGVRSQGSPGGRCNVVLRGGMWCARQRATVCAGSSRLHDERHSTRFRPRDLIHPSQMSLPPRADQDAVGEGTGAQRDTQGACCACEQVTKRRQLYRQLHHPCAECRNVTLHLLSVELAPDSVCFARLRIASLFCCK